MHIAVGMAAAAIRLDGRRASVAPVSRARSGRQEFVLALKWHYARRSPWAPGAAGLIALNELIAALAVEVNHEHGNMPEVDTLLASIAATAARLSDEPAAAAGRSGGSAMTRRDPEERVRGLFFVVTATIDELETATGWPPDPRRPDLPALIDAARDALEEVSASITAPVIAEAEGDAATAVSEWAARHGGDED